MAEYHGWIIKVTWSHHAPYFLPWAFRQKRTDVVKAFENSWTLPWRKYRQRGTHKIVKVKFVEVE